MDTNLISPEKLMELCGGQTPHRMDWTREMLPEGYRPALLRERDTEPGWMQSFTGETWLPATWHGFSGVPCDAIHHRTRRPLPAQAPKEARPLIEAEITNLLGNCRAWRSRAESAEARVQELETLINSTPGVNTLRNISDAQAKEIDALKEHVAQLELAVAHWKKHHATAEARVKELEGELAGPRGDNFPSRLLDWIVKFIERHGWVRHPESMGWWGHPAVPEKGNHMGYMFALECMAESFSGHQEALKRAIAESKHCSELEQNERSIRVTFEAELATAENRIKELEVQLAKSSTWIPVSTPPTETDADEGGRVAIKLPGGHVGITHISNLGDAISWFPLPPSVQSEEETMRKGFEEWAKDSEAFYQRNYGRSGSDYLDKHLQTAWLAWQASQKGVQS